MEYKIISTGNSGLDDMLDGGICVGSTLVVVGAPGIGKTVLTTGIALNYCKEHYVLLFEVSGERNQAHLKHAREIFGKSNIRSVSSLEDISAQSEVSGTVSLVNNPEVIRQFMERYSSNEKYSVGRPMVCIFDGEDVASEGESQSTALRKSLSKCIQLRRKYDNKIIVQTLGVRDIRNIMRDPSRPSTSRLIANAEYGIAMGFASRQDEQARCIAVTKCRLSRPSEEIHDFVIESGGLNIHRYCSLLH